MTPLFPALLIGLAMTASASAVDLHVRIDGMRSDKGVVSICVFRREAGFPDCASSPGTLKATLDAAGAGKGVLFAGLEAGPFAVSVLHDENANGRLDTGLFGIPKEGVGISNNRLPRFSAPSFTDAAFDLRRSGSQSIRLIYR